MDPVELTKELVSIETVSSGTDLPFCEHLAALLEPLGAAVHIQRSDREPAKANLLARFGPDEAGGLVLSGHADTVPWNPAGRATLRAEIQGDRLYGRGTCDMKGAIAAMVCAAASLGGRELRRPLWLAFTFDEETGCTGCRLLLSCGGLRAAHCIVGEPTAMRPVVVHKGYMGGRIELSGVPCHSSDPDRGVSAILAAARAIEALQALAGRWKGRPSGNGLLEPPWATLNVGLVAGGEARNVVPSRASVEFEFRPLPGGDERAAACEIAGAVGQAVASVPGAGWREVESGGTGPFEEDPDARLIRWLVSRTGKEPGGVPYFTEAPFWKAMGAVTCVCGPGEIAQAHRDDEWVDVAALRTATEVYRDAIEEFCR